MPRTIVHDRWHGAWTTGSGGFGTEGGSDGCGEPPALHVLVLRWRNLCRPPLAAALPRGDPAARDDDVVDPCRRS